MVNKRDAEVFIVYLSYHFDVGLFHVIGQGGTPLAFLDDTCILSMRFGYSYFTGHEVFNL
jgi:hypothetical protein